MEEQFGGPVWHASARAVRGGHAESVSLAREAIRGVGDAALGEWQFDGEFPGVVHVQRRLSADERKRYAVPEPYDIRGTAEETLRIAAVYAEAPGLRGVMP